MAKQTREAQFALPVPIPSKRVILYDVPHPTHESEKLEAILKNLALSFQLNWGDLPYLDVPHLFTHEISKLSSLSYKVVLLKLILKCLHC